MAIGIIGRKLGMSRIFTEEGSSIPVTLIEVESNRITRIKKADGKDGYNAVQITAGARRAKRVNRPLTGHYKKAGVEAGGILREFRVDKITDDLQEGGEIGFDIFAEGNIVDVTAVSKGKGFQGGIKRHNFRGQDNSHGNSLAHRALGSIGQCQTPGRVFKGKKMAGHMGHEKVTTQNLTIVKMDAENRLIMIKGAVPGAKGGDVVIKPAVKKSGAKQ